MKTVVTGLLLLLLIMPTLAQDDEPTPVENFGQVLFSFALEIDDDDFGHARTLAASRDLKRYYVAGGDGYVYVYDDKGRYLEIIDTGFETPISDLAVDDDDRLYVVQSGSILLYDQDLQQIREIPGRLPGPYYSQIILLDDGTFYATQFFGPDNAFYHLNPDGTIASEAKSDFFSNLSDERVNMFDALRVGQDGYLYYFNQSSEIFFQFTEDGEILNRYRSLIDTFSLRGGILIDELSQVLLGAGGGIEIYGAKESLVNMIRLETSGFVHDMAFVSDGRLIAVQPDSVSVIQYGARDR